MSLIEHKEVAYRSYEAGNKQRQISVSFNTSLSLASY
jgi:hypothetical protein